MLGLKDPKDDSFCEYERRQVATRPKKQKSDATQKEIYDRMALTKKNSCPVVKEFDEHGSNITVEDVKNVHQAVGDVKDTKDPVGYFNSPEQSEENSKAFMESIGSWINDFFNAPNKKPLPTEEKSTIRKTQTIDDPEYLKSICEIKEQFKKKLTRVTSVHVSGSDKPLDFEFDKVLDGNKKKRSSSLPPPTTPNWWEELGELENQVTETPEYLNEDHGGNHNTAALLIRTTETEDFHQKSLHSKTHLDLDHSNLVKKKRKVKGKNRTEVNELEEYIFPSSAELSRKILLNVHEKEKCIPSYKNPHLGVQESQPYGQMKKKTYQNNARCYTTNANLTELSESSTSKPFSSSNRFSHCCTTDAAAMRGASEILNKNSLGFRKSQSRRPSRKAVSELSRDSMTFIKVKSPKSLANFQPESPKGEIKSSSDELVKYLMKKIKTNHRPQQPKKKGSINVPQVLSSPKNRFMQSATNSLVMSVMAKNDSPGKGSRIENKLYPGKELFAKYSDNGIRFDVSRAVSPSKFSKCTYLLEGERVSDDSYLLDKTSYKNTRRPFEDLLKRDSKRNSKRQEIKNMFSNLDMKFNVFQVPKTKPKEPKKKPTPIISESFETEETKETQTGRFKRQHELFKTNLKLAEENQASETHSPVIEPEKEISTETPAANLLPAELAVIDPNLQLASEEKAEPLTEQLKPESGTTVSPKEPEYKIIDCLGLEEKPSSLKTEKQTSKEKLYKHKSVHYLKDNDSKMLLSPLAECCHSETQPHKEMPKPYDAPLFPADLRPAKPGETSVLNRRFSTNTLMETGQKIIKKEGNQKSFQTYTATLYLTDMGKETEGDKKESKDKKKTKTSIGNGPEGASSDNPCGFEKVTKKPAPNCEKEQQ